jgi:hypothetical protein
VRGRREVVTTEQPEHWLTMRQASAVVGLDTSGARLIHHYSNAIYLLPAHDAVARITYGPDAAEQVARSQAITRWLGQQHQFPATQPLDNTSPVTVNSAVVSFWDYYPQPKNGPPLTSRQLAALLRLLHQVGTPPIALPTWIPLAALHATVGDSVQSAALTNDERTWIQDQIAEARDKIAGLDWPLGTGLIHGDAWAGNLLSCTGAPPPVAVLGDWDWVSVGPREIDLIPPGTRPPDMANQLLGSAISSASTATTWPSGRATPSCWPCGIWSSSPGRSAAPATPSPTARYCGNGSTASGPEILHPSGQRYETVLPA